MYPIYLLFCPNKLNNISLSHLILILNRIKIVLVEKNKTAKWLSEQVGRNVTSVSRWCTNASQPDLETLFRIAELLDVDVRELLHVEKDKYK